MLMANWPHLTRPARSILHLRAPPRAAAPKRQVVRMGNKGSGGPFAPLVVVVRNAVGEKGGW